MNKACIFFKMSDLINHYRRNFEKFDDVVIEKNIVFDDRYGKYTRADALYTAGLKNYPVLINVHGGGFVKGDKRHRRAICAKFAQKGWFVFNMNYRLAPQHQFPSAVEDVVNALNFLPAIKEKYGLDFDRIVLTGDSAGAYYSASAIISTINDNFRKALNLPEYKGKIAGFMGFCGPYNLEKILAVKTPFDVAKDIATALFGYEIEKDFSNLRTHSLFEYTNLLNFIDKNFPKSYIMASRNDKFCFGQGEFIEDKLQENNVEYTAYYAENEEDFHCFHLLPRHSGTKKCMEGAYKWLKTFE